MLYAVALHCWSEGGVLVLPHLCEMRSLGGQSEVDEAPTSGVLLAVGGPLVTQGCRSHNALELVSRKETTKKGITKGTSRSFTRHLQKKCRRALLPRTGSPPKLVFAKTLRPSRCVTRT